MCLCNASYAEGTQLYEQHYYLVTSGTPIAIQGSLSAVFYKHTDLYVTDTCDPCPERQPHTESRLDLVGFLPPVAYFFPLSFPWLLLLPTVPHPNSNPKVFLILSF